MNRKRLVAIVVALGILAAVAWGVKVWLSPPPRMNVLVVTLDTTRADRIGCYGYEGALTPNLDRLADEGVLFERAYAPAPLTLPSHATIFTGLLPPEHGLRINGNNSLDEQISTLADLLSERGYRTAAFVAAFVLDSKFGLDGGFEVYDDDLAGTPNPDHPLHRARSGQQVANRALSWLDRQGDEPFLCWVHLYDPHHPCLEHRELFGDRFAGRPYDAEIAYADFHVGRLLKRLKERGLDRQTLVVVVGDHGEGLGEHGERTHGNMLYNSTMHVPLIVSQPGRFAAGRRERALVALDDLFPTILDCLEVPAAASLGGRSLRPALLGESFSGAACYGETDEPFLENGWAPLRSLTTDNWKYIRTTRVELYDLREDPGELRNLAAAQPDQVHVLDSQLRELENRLASRAAPAAHLSAKEQRVLESLGYAGGVRAADDAPRAHALPDVKDMIGHFNRLGEARELMHQRDFEQASQVLRQIVKEAPEYARAHGLLGVCLAEMGRYDEAEKEYRHVLQTERDVDSARLNLGLLAKAQNKWDEAIGHLEELLKTNPQSADAHFYLAGIYEAGENDDSDSDVSENIRKAVAHYATVTRLQPDHLEALVRLAWLLSTCGDAQLRNGKRAVGLAKKACELTGNGYPPALDALAAAQAEAGRYAEAIRTMNRCLSIPGVESDSKYARELRARLMQYRAGQPWRGK